VIPVLALAAEGSESLPFIILGLWILLLAIFVGFELISKVPPTLHTPLMSGSNAISGITLVGALYCAGAEYTLLGKVFGVIAIAMATTNVVGGFLVTDRMLAMFGTRKPTRRS
jgi:proton-translocating NAD(P)+ transhydrogenase subunit alpha